MIAGLVLAITIWIVVPGPVLPLFILSVGATEFWPVFALPAAALLIASLVARSRMLAVIATSALLCTLVPPVMYVVNGPRVPFSALLQPWPLADHTRPLRSDAPVVVAIYGGAWQRGSPRNDAPLNARIASWGYQVVAADYPHAPQARWPAQRDAILRTIDRLHAAKIVLLGHSSGAQLAMIAGALRAGRISGIITYESPVDLALGYEHPSQPDIIDARKIMSDLCGGPPQSQPACYRSGSPRYVVHRGMPPVLMLAAGRDHVVNVDFEHVLRDRLRNDGVDVAYVELPWADHAFETVAFGFHNRIAMFAVRRFLDGIGGR